MDVDDLYALPLDQFVSERGALARALRADGHREQAASVASLRKPSVAAWAVNQLVRTQTKALDELFAAGDALRRAQEDVVAGRGDAHAMRAAGEDERAAVDALVAAARGLLTSDGHELGAAIVERVAATVHAAALEEEARQHVRGGRLERELRHVGLGVGASIGEGAGPTAPSRAPKPQTSTEKAASAETPVKKPATPPASRAVDSRVLAAASTSPSSERPRGRPSATACKHGVRLAPPRPRHAA